jgi:prophage maintenance system killer protein
MTKEKKKSRPLTSELVLLVYKILLNNSLVSFDVPKDGKAKIDSFVGVINGQYFGICRYPTQQLKASALFFYIVKAHAFTDGNKRTAVLAFVTYCDLNKLTILTPLDSLDSLAVYIEESKPEDPHHFIEILSVFLFN